MTVKSVHTLDTPGVSGRHGSRVPLSGLQAAQKRPGRSTNSLGFFMPADAGRGGVWTRRMAVSVTSTRV
jgi:hypothetical protein